MFILLSLWFAYFFTEDILGYAIFYCDEIFAKSLVHVEYWFLISSNFKCEGEICGYIFWTKLRMCCCIVFLRATTWDLGLVSLVISLHCRKILSETVIIWNNKLSPAKISSKKFRLLIWSVWFGSVQNK